MKVPTDQRAFSRTVSSARGLSAVKFYVSPQGLEGREDARERGLIHEQVDVDAFRTAKDTSDTESERPSDRIRVAGFLEHVSDRTTRLGGGARWKHRQRVRPRSRASAPDGRRRQRIHRGKRSGGNVARTNRPHRVLGAVQRLPPELGATQAAITRHLVENGLVVVNDPPG